MATSPRANRKLSRHELARFLGLLARTGNFALASARLGRAQSGLYKRRIRDPRFDSECVAALALFRSSPSLSGGGGPSKTVEGPPQAVEGPGGGAITLTTYAGHPQLRRARPGTLTQPRLDTFLRTLAATGNIRFAARSIGVAPSSIHARIRTDPAFAAEIAIAQDTARATLEMNLIEAANAFFDDPLNPPCAEHGEGDHPQDGGGAQHGGGAQDGGGPHDGGAAHDGEGPPFTTRMTVSEAIRLVGRLDRSLARDAARHVRPERVEGPAPEHPVRPERVEGPEPEHPVRPQRAEGPAPDAPGVRETAALLPRAGVWAWLYFVLRDSVVPKNKSGKRVPGELHRWWPSDPGDWQKAQRHLVRMPVVLLAELRDAADHLICGSPDVLPEIREQLTSQQDMFHPEFQKAARQLYFDFSKGTLKRGSGGKGAGTPRRLAKLRSQLDVTWNLFDLDAAHIVRLLPKEFNRFLPRAT